MKLLVDKVQRFAKMRAHTATHLFHHELTKLFPDTKQAGSLVDEDFLRFDFAAPRQITPDELKVIEKTINEIIMQAITVEKNEMPIEEAKKLGAKSFFEDKYGDKVRVISIEESDVHSKEFCGGTHVENTKDIGCFAIVSQEAVAQGVRRITAYTGPKVASFLEEKKDIIDHTSSLLDCQEKQLIERAEKMIKEHKDLQSRYESLETAAGREALQKKNLINSGVELLKKNLIEILHISSEDTLLVSLDFKKIVELAIGLWKTKNILIARYDGQYALLCGSGNCKAKEVAKELGLKGGGSDLLAQGKDDGVKKLLL